MEDLDAGAQHEGGDGVRIAQARGGGVGDVEDKIAAAVVIVADEGRTSRYSLHSPDEVYCHAMC